MTVTRWRRHGKDRLYVNDPSGKRLGWYDVQSGQRVTEVPARADDVGAAVDAWLRTNSDGPQADVPQSSIERRQEPCPPPWPAGDVESALSARETVLSASIDRVADLALNEAGAAAREQAILRRQAAPVRTTVARLLGVRTEERAWRIGADGEEKVAARLAKLGPRWKVLHAVPIGEMGADIDHVVIGPGGVFTLNAKHHPGAKIWVAGDSFMVDGSRQPYIHKSRSEAKRASALLSRAAGRPVAAIGVIVPVGAVDLRIKRAPGDVVVVSRMQVAKWLASRPEVMSDGEIDAVYGLARRPDLWRSPGS